MANWNPIIVERNHATKPKSEDHNAEDKTEGLDNLSIESPPGNNRHEYSLRPSKKILIAYPSDFTVDEAKSIKSFADYLISIRGGDQN